jgi:hypothetical protein
MKKENFKHTPGPWRIGEYAVNDYCPTIYGPDGFAICTMEQGNVNIADIVEADARLIAACPDMLEALQLVVDGLSAFVFKMNVKDHFSEKLAMESARTAIKKALGE